MSAASACQSLSVIRRGWAGAGRQHHNLITGARAARTAHCAARLCAPPCVQLPGPPGQHGKGPAEQAKAALPTQPAAVPNDRIIMTNRKQVPHAPRARPRVAFPFYLLFKCQTISLTPPPEGIGRAWLASTRSSPGSRRLPGSISASWVPASSANGTGCAQVHSTAQPHSGPPASLSAAHRGSESSRSTADAGSRARSLRRRGATTAWIVHFTGRQGRHCLKTHPRPLMALIRSDPAGGLHGVTWRARDVLHLPGGHALAARRHGGTPSLGFARTAPGGAGLCHGLH